MTVLLCPPAGAASDRLTRRLGLTLCAGGLVLLLSGAAVVGQEQEAKDETSAPPIAPKKVEMKATELGVRFTPRMAKVIGSKIATSMKGRYDLSDQQVEEVQQILSTQFVDFAHKNAQTSRDMIEMMIETMMENDGTFPREQAQEFAKVAKPFVPAFRDFFTETSGMIGQKMTMKQRLKFTGDLTAASAGLTMFENRMKRWEEGKVGKTANPFWDTGDDETATSLPDEPEDPNEPAEHRQARQNVERWIEWQIDIDKQWEGYVERTTEFYGFNEVQQNSAKAILDDCRQRAQRIKTPEWRASLIENRIARQLSWNLGAEASQGPFMYKLETEWERLRKPLLDIERELKRRLEELPTSEQRATARESVRKALSERGVKKLPI